MESTKTGHRYTYKGVGIYSALKEAMSHSQWIYFLNSDIVTWLPKPVKYKTNNYLYYFTDKGNNKFRSTVFYICKLFLDENNIEYSVQTFQNDIIEYSDEYQFVVPCSDNGGDKMDSIKPVWSDHLTDEEEVENLKEFSEALKQLAEDVGEYTSTVKPQPDLLQLLEIARENNRIRMEMNKE